MLKELPHCERRSFPLLGSGSCLLGVSEVWSGLPSTSPHLAAPCLLAVGAASVKCTFINHSEASRSQAGLPLMLLKWKKKK